MVGGGVLGATGAIGAIDVGATGAGVATGGGGVICCPAVIPDLVARLCSAVHHTAFTPI